MIPVEISSGLGSSFFFRPILYCRQGHRERGQGGTMTPGPMGFRGAHGLQEGHSNDTMKSACEA